MEKGSKKKLIVKKALEALTKQVLRDQEAKQLKGGGGWPGRTHGMVV